MKKLTLLLISLLTLAGCAAHYNQAGWAAFNKGDYLEAEKQWSEALKHNAPGAFTGLGVLADPDTSSVGSSGKSLDQAVAYYFHASEMGEPIAMNNLGLLLMNYGNEDDKQAAISYFTYAARLGLPAAITNLKHYGLPVPDNDLQRAKLNDDISTIALIFMGLAIANTPTAPSSTPSLPLHTALNTNATNQGHQQSSSSMACTSDLSCRYGQTCLKKIGQPLGVCITSVDSNKMPTLNAPSPTLEIRSFSDKMCRLNSDCPTGFVCNQQYFACVSQ